MQERRKGERRKSERRWNLLAGFFSLWTKRPEDRRKADRRSGEDRRKRS